jgi:hypothetical protein
MTAIAVEIGPRPPVIRPEEHAASVATPVLVRIADMDDVTDSVKCSCNAGDDNPF